VIWAFIGIAIKRQDDYKLIFITAIIAIALVAMVTLWGFHFSLASITASNGKISR